MTQFYQVILENIIYNPDGTYRPPEVYDDLPYSIAKVGDLVFDFDGKVREDSMRWLDDAVTLYNLINYKGH